MKRMVFIRLGGLATMASGLLFVTYSVLDFSSGFFSPSSSVYRTMDVLLVVAHVLVAVGFVGFHALQGQNYARIGRAGFWMVVIASLAVALGLITYFFLDISGFLWLVTSVGPVGLLVGLVLYGAATLQAKVLPLWCGIAFLIGLPVAWVSMATRSFFVLPGDIILFGLVWLALGYALWARRGVATERPSRVR